MEECFYKITVTKGAKETVWHYGYMLYKEIYRDVEKFYSEGADAVEMEMITQAEFDKEMEPYYDRS